MNIISLILIIISGVCFLLSSGPFVRRTDAAVGYNLIPVGLLFFVTSWAVQLLWVSHAQQIHF